jgi:hypothetical protein
MEVSKEKSRPGEKNSVIVPKTGIASQFKGGWVMISSNHPAVFRDDCQAVNEEVRRTAMKNGRRTSMTDSGASQGAR